MRHTLHRTAAIALALTALGAPAAVAQEGGGSWTPPRDMRSPDARDAAAGRGAYDVKDVAAFGGRLSPAGASDSGRQNPAPVADDGGIDWADAGIGAGVLGGLVLLAGGGVLVVHRRSAPAA
jgi:hypothetical protein